MKQTFCVDCGGLKTLSAVNVIIDPKDWMKHGMASDIGCICKNDSPEVNTMDKKIEKKLLDIARRNLGFETLESQKSDRLDFREVSCWNVHRALQEAFVSGQQFQNGKGFDFGQ